MRNILALSALFFFILSACTRKINKTIVSHKIQVSFLNVFGGQKLSLHKKYKTLKGQTLILTKLQYYISHIELEDRAGNVWKEENSIRLIIANEEENGSGTNITLKGFPLKEVAKIRFSVGVDTLTNAKSGQEGYLDPSYGMFWTWKTGYIFFKAEGYYLGKSKSGLIYHIGGNEAYKTIELVLNNNPQQINILADIQKLFGGFNGDAIILDNSEAKNDIMGGKQVVKVAENYAQMFSLKP